MRYSREKNDRGERGESLLAKNAEGAVDVEPPAKSQVDRGPVARGLAPAGARSGPKIGIRIVSGITHLPVFTTASQPNGAVRRSDKPLRHKGRRAISLFRIERR